MRYEIMVNNKTIFTTDDYEMAYESYISLADFANTTDAYVAIWDTVLKEYVEDYYGNPF